MKGFKLIIRKIVRYLMKSLKKLKYFTYILHIYIIYDFISIFYTTFMYKE